MSGRPRLILMAGMPGSGKSTLALALGKRLGWPVIDKDVILSAMLDELPNDVAQPVSYAVMFALGREMLGIQQQSVILDSPAGHDVAVTTAEVICHEAGAELRIVLCLADRDTRNARVRSRISQRSQPVGTSATAGTGVERFAHLPGTALHVDTGQDLERNVATVLAWLREPT